MHAVTSDNHTRVFVYGTLRRGERNHGYLHSARWLGAHVTPPRYVLFDTGPYPAAVRGGRTPLTGEVYAVDRRAFRRLDRLEHYPRHYTRQRIATPFGMAWIYLWIARTDRRWRRLDGDWCQR